MSSVQTHKPRIQTKRSVSGATRDAKPRLQFDIGATTLWQFDTAARHPGIEELQERRLGILLSLHTCVCHPMISSRIQSVLRFGGNALDLRGCSISVL
jgi:hypothetical protein